MGSTLGGGGETSVAAGEGVVVHFGNFSVGLRDGSVVGGGG